MKRKLTLLTALVLIFSCLGFGTSLAYFTDSKQAQNVFTIGNVDITLTEPSWPKELTPVYPGQILPKDPTVTNTGANPCFVRIALSGLDTFGAEGTIRLRTGGNDGLGSGWFLGKDGLYYYNRPLEPGEATPPLFDSIVIPTGVTRQQEQMVHSLLVSAQAVQAQGAQPDYADVIAMTPAQIESWFQTVMDS